MPEIATCQNNEILQIKSLSPEIIRQKTEKVRELFIGKPIYMIRNKKGKFYPYVPLELTDSCPATRPSLIEDMADLLIYHGNFDNIDLLVSEGDRGGGPLTQEIARKTGIPYVLANWNAEEIPGAISMPVKVGFSGDGYLCLFDLKKDQKVAVVDDLLSSGGTAEGLIKAILEAGATVNEALFVGEKVNKNGRKLLIEKFPNIAVKTLVKFNAIPFEKFTTEAYEVDKLIELIGSRNPFDSVDIIHEIANFENLIYDQVKNKRKAEEIIKNIEIDCLRAYNFGGENHFTERARKTIEKYL